MWQAPALRDEPIATRADPVRESVRRLLAALPQREDTRVLCDFVEDDLREGLAAIADVEAHFTDLLDALARGPLTPVALLDASEDLRVLQRLEYLHNVIAQLRRRISQAAARVHDRNAAR